MAWTYRKRIKIIPGIHLNIGKYGISTTIGVPGASINLGKNGSYLNAGIPGTGLSFRHKIRPSTSTAEFDLNTLPAQPIVPEDHFNEISDFIDNIFSLDPEEITSKDMQGIKDTIMSAHEQRTELLQDLNIVQNQLHKTEFKLSLSYWLIYGFLLKERTQNLKDDISLQKQVIEEIKKQTGNTAVKLDFKFDTDMSLQYSKLYACFEKVSKCQIIWDITSEQENDRFATRSAASSSVMRKPVHFKTGHLPEIKSETPAMIWDNANGADLYFYPNFMIVWNNRAHFAIVAYNELEINFTPTRFIETEKVPSDSKVVDQTWFKVNKNGSPDKRFKDNYKIPVVSYGDIELKTKTGLNERYLFSNYENARAFNLAFLEYQISLIKLDYIPMLPEMNPG